MASVGLQLKVGWVLHQVVGISSHGEWRTAERSFATLAVSKITIIKWMKKQNNKEERPVSTHQK